VKKNSNRGFTLLELLLGLTLTGLLLTILFSALRLAQRSDEAGRARQEQSQHMRIVSDRLTWLIRGAYPYFYKKDNQPLLSFDGESDNLTFVTTSIDSYDETLEDLAGLKKIKIFVDGDGLKISEQVFYMDEGGHDYVLDPLVKDISFEYLDVDEEDSSSTWVDSWDNTEKKTLPAAVRIKLKFKGGKAGGEKNKEGFFPEVIAYIHASQPEKNK
jgi:general secretion pathway protein J